MEYKHLPAISGRLPPRIFHPTPPHPHSRRQVNLKTETFAKVFYFESKFQGIDNFESIQSLKNPTLVTIPGLILTDEQSSSARAIIPIKIGIEV